MRCGVLGVAAFVAAFLLVAVVCNDGQGEAREIRTLELVVRRPAGPPVLLQFVVAAADAEEARVAAERVALELVPGGDLGPAPAGVSAAWQQWGWTWDEDEMPVRVAYNPEGAAPGASPDTVLFGLQAWSAVPGSAFAFDYAGITDNVASILETGPDGENVVSWKSLDCTLGCVLGVASKEQVHEADLVLNSNPAAATQAGIGGTLDWRTVILHELGHVAGLEHSCPAPFGMCTDEELRAVMYYQYSGVQRVLEPDDVAGLVALYPEQAPGPEPTPSPFPETVVRAVAGWNLTLLPSGSAANIAERMACVGAIYHWDGTGWRTWIRGLSPALQDLETTQSGSGYWLWATGACTGEFPGF